MIDESFHLTPVDVRRREFATAIRGYDKTSVDVFRDQLADELENLSRRNQELEQKARGFHEQLRAFRERDKALNDALVSAQQLRGEIREQADREAQLILREARAEGEKMLVDARADAERIVVSAREDVRRLASDVESLERTRRAYLSQLRNLVERQLAEIDAMAGVPAPVPPPVPSVAAPAPMVPPAPSTAPSMRTPAWLDRTAE